MKLRNFMYATMIACAFASCSNDDVPTPDQGDPSAEGTTLAVKYDASSLTKATTDATISSLQLLVFNADGNLEAKGSLKNGTTDVAEATGLTAGRKDVIVFANVTLPEAVVVGASKSTVFGALEKDFDNALEADGALTMNSKMYEDIEIALNTVNLLGYDAETGGKWVGNVDKDIVKVPVKLYRNVAKIRLASISTRMKDEVGKKYSNPTLKVKEIFILQGHKVTKLFGTNQSEYGATEVNGSYYSAYEHTSDWTSKDDIYTLAESGVTVKAGDWIKKSISEVTVTTAVKYETVNDFYVYENTSDTYKTLLVVKGDFIYNTTDTETKTLEDRFYTAEIGKDVTLPAGSSTLALLALRDVTPVAENGKYTIGVYRNLQYNIDLTVTGPGYQTPGGGGDPTVLDVKCEVVDFGQVDQDVEI